MSLARQIQETLGQPELLKVLRKACDQSTTEFIYLKNQESLCDSLFQDPAMLDHLLAISTILREKPELAVALVQNAFRHASTDKIRREIKALALKFKLEMPFKRKQLEEPGYFTTGQAELFKRVDHMAEVYFSGSKHLGVSLRLLALLLGPSGTGKTHLACALAKKMGIPFCRLTVGDWLVAGSRNDPNTLQVLQRHLDESPRIVLFLDELDKFRLDDTGWSRSVMTEVFSVLDRKVNYRGTDAKPWTQTHSDRLENGVFIIAAGTWQDIWQSQAKAPVGFAGEQAHVFDERAFKKSIRAAQMIPTELLNRFNENWLILRPYTVDDFARISRDLNLAPGVLDPAAAAAEGLNYRAVENAVSELALRPPLTEQQIALSMD